MSEQSAVPSYIEYLERCVQIYLDLCSVDEYIFSEDNFRIFMIVGKRLHPVCLYDHPDRARTFRYNSLEGPATLAFLDLIMRKIIDIETLFNE